MRYPPASPRCTLTFGEAAGPAFGDAGLEATMMARMRLSEHDWRRITRYVFNQRDCGHMLLHRSVGWGAPEKVPCRPFLN